MQRQEQTTERCVQNPPKRFTSGSFPAWGTCMDGPGSAHFTLTGTTTTTYNTCRRGDHQEPRTDLAWSLQADVSGMSRAAGRGRQKAVVRRLADDSRALIIMHLRTNPALSKRGEQRENVARRRVGKDRPDCPPISEDQLISPAFSAKRQGGAGQLHLVRLQFCPAATRGQFRHSWLSPSPNTCKIGPRSRGPVMKSATAKILPSASQLPAEIPRIGLPLRLPATPAYHLHSWCRRVGIRCRYDVSRSSGTMPRR